MNNQREPNTVDPGRLSGIPAGRKNESKSNNTIGLSCDIVGAILVAIKVVKVYRGEITGTMKHT